MDVSASDIHEDMNNIPLADDDPQGKYISHQGLDVRSNWVTCDGKELKCLLR